MPEAVNHPIHYGGSENPYEHIKVCRAWALNYELGNATKYICRAGKKGDAIEDLKKAAWYIHAEIARRDPSYQPPQELLDKVAQYLTDEGVPLDGLVLLPGEPVVLARLRRYHPS